MRSAILWATVVVGVLGSPDGHGRQQNGFDLTGALVPEKEILGGGPPRDGIPAIYGPKFLRAAVQSDLKDGDRVLGVFVGGVAKAFPVTILEHHEVVNDWSQQTHMVVTYCPLCGSGMAFRTGDEGKAVYGVSGLLYNSDVLLYDHATESLWSQILGLAITGSKKGEKLTSIPTVHTTWGAWLARHPQTYVMTRETGYSGIDYRSGPDAYKGYERSRRIWFPVANKDRRYHPKSWVLGLQLAGTSKAYPFEELAQSSGVVQDQLGGTEVTIHFDGESAWAEDAAGALLPAIRLYWFAWVGFHPETLVFVVDEER